MRGLYTRPHKRGSAHYTDTRRNEAQEMHAHVKWARTSPGVVPVTDTHVDPEVAAVVDAITGIGDTTRLTHVRQQALSVVVNAFHNVDHLAAHLRRDRRHPNSVRSPSPPRLRGSSTVVRGGRLPATSRTGKVPSSAVKAIVTTYTFSPPSITITQQINKLNQYL